MEIETIKEWSRYLEAAISSLKQLWNLGFAFPPDFDYEHYMKTFEKTAQTTRDQIAEYEGKQDTKPNAVPFDEPDAAWQDDAPPDFISTHDEDEDEDISFADKG